MCGGFTLMESMLLSGRQQEVFPSAYLQPALTHTFEQTKHTANFVQACALMLTVFSVITGNTQGQLLTAAMLNTPVIQVPRAEHPPLQKAIPLVKGSMRSKWNKFVWGWFSCLTPTQWWNISPRYRLAEGHLGAPGDVYLMEGHCSGYCSSP